MSEPAVVLNYPLVPDPEAWIVPEGQVPEAPLHDLVARRVDTLVRSRAEKLGMEASVHRNLALHWRREHPRSGVDPDVVLVAPPIGGWPEAPGSLRLWLPRTPKPLLAVEVVSTTHPNKDYAKIHERYADLAIPELWVLDPLSVGPRVLGGPVPLQQWLTTAQGFERVHFGCTAFRSPVLSLWVHALDASPGVALSLDAAGNDPVLDAEQEARAAEVAQRERAEAERDRAEAERDRAEAAERRAQELARELAALRGAPPPR